MLLDFALLSMSDLRKEPGEILDRVAEGGAFIIERSGQRKACLVPLSVFFPDISPSRIADEFAELEKHGEKFRTTSTNHRELAIRVDSDPNVAAGTIELTIVLPHGYPNSCPRVYASLDDAGVPHRWHDGALCLYGVMSGWNPGRHTVYTTLTLARQWLRHYRTWRDSGHWPIPGDANA